MSAVIGGFAILFGLFCVFSEGAWGMGLFALVVGALFVWAGWSQEDDNNIRHKSDYGNVAKCPFCGSTDVYAMTWDDKRDSVAFWGTASSKVGKRYHCDNCGKEW